jgi:hypothetical protein
VSTAVFYVLAVLIVVAALGAVLAPSTRQVLIAVMAGDILVGILLIAAGAYVLGVIALVAPAGCLLVVAVLLRRSGYEALLSDIPAWGSSWPVAAVVAGGIGVLLLWTTATRINDSAGGGGQSLVTVLHYGTPISLGVAAVLAVVAVAGGLMIGRTGDDERLLDRAAEQRRLREERTRMRRQHRAAARAQRDGRGGAAQ